MTFILECGDLEPIVCTIYKFWPIPSKLADFMADFVKILFVLYKAQFLQQDFHIEMWWSGANCVLSIQILANSIQIGRFYGRFCENVVYTLQGTISTVGLSYWNVGIWSPLYGPYWRFGLFHQNWPILWPNLWKSCLCSTRYNFVSMTFMLICGHPVPTQRKDQDLPKSCSWIIRNKKPLIKWKENLVITIMHTKNKHAHTVLITHISCIAGHMTPFSLWGDIHFPGKVHYSFMNFGPRPWTMLR